MKYEKINSSNYSLHYIKTDNFKTNLIKVCFMMPISKERITLNQLLLGIMSRYSNNYRTLKETTLEEENLYQVSYSAAPICNADYLISDFSLKFIDEKYTEDGMNEKSINYLMQAIFDPFVEDNKFNSEVFNLEKNDYMEFLEGKNDNPLRYLSDKVLNIIGKNTTLELDSAGDIDVLKSITESSLYEHYLYMIKNSKIDIFYSGNIEREKLISYVDKYFLNKSLSFPYKKVIKLEKIEEKNIIEKSHFKQTKLKIAYVFDELNDYERLYVAPIFNYILGGSSSSLLFSNVREKNSLCYDIHSGFSTSFLYLMITMGIEAKNMEKAINLSLSMVDKMINGEYSEQAIDDTKTYFLSSLDEIYDTQGNIISIYQSKEYKDFDYPEERIKKIQKVTKEDLINLSKKMRLELIYCLEGND